MFIYPERESRKSWWEMCKDCWIDVKISSDHCHCQLHILKELQPRLLLSGWVAAEAHVAALICSRNNCSAMLTLHPGVRYEDQTKGLCYTSYNWNIQSWWMGDNWPIEAEVSLPLMGHWTQEDVRSNQPVTATTLSDLVTITWLYYF